jgi:hypothetical protein
MSQKCILDIRDIQANRLKSIFDGILEIQEKTEICGTLAASNRGG